MLTDRLYIDGLDAFTNFGLLILAGGYNELLAYPSLKPIDYNDWQEEDGIEPDLSNPKLDTKTFSIRFGLSGTQYRLGTLLELLSDGAYHSFHFKEISQARNLRLVGHTDNDLAVSIGFITLTLADDYPLAGYTYTAPTTTLPTLYDYKIDDLWLSQYGIRAIQGTLAEILRAGEVKPNLLRNISTQAGAEYDGNTVVFREKQARLFLHMTAETLTQLWGNYNALLYNLTRPGIRQLYLDDTGQTLPCFYHSSTVTAFYPTGKIWLDFTLTLTFTAFRLGEEEFILATENDQAVTTEEAIEPNAINLSHYD